MKYNKGDLVQVVNQDSAYRIEKVFKRDYAPYKVRNMTDGRWDIVEEDELKPWEEREPKFKVGDWVRFPDGTNPEEIYEVVHASYRAVTVGKKVSNTGSPDGYVKITMPVEYTEKISAEERIAKLEAEVAELKLAKPVKPKYEFKKISEVEPGDKVVTREGPVVEIVQTTKTVSVGEEDKYSLVDANHMRRLAGTDKTTPEVKVVKEIKQYSYFYKPVRELQVGDMVRLFADNKYHELIKVESEDNMTPNFRYLLNSKEASVWCYPDTALMVRVDRDSR